MVSSSLHALRDVIVSKTDLASLDASAPIRVQFKVKDLPLLKRIAWVLAAAAIQSIYIPTSQNLTGGIMPKIAWDVFPVYPIWVVVYLLCFPLWLSGIVWSIWKMEALLFRTLITACLFTFPIAIAIFVFYPTYVELPRVEGTGPIPELLRQVQKSGGQYDALPSGHLYITTLLALFFGCWYPRVRLLWAAIVVIVALSTLFTGQHYVLDVIGGILLGWLGYRFGLWWNHVDTKGVIHG
jgi:membrane-associated phospholipid phosphatase